MSATNEAIEGNTLTLGELLKYFGIWLLMSTFITSCNRRYWFGDSSQPSIREGAPSRLGHYMNGYRFDQITSATRFTMREPPTWKDRFHQVNYFIKAFNDHINIIFIPDWISCLDESMSLWTIRWT